jgi:hypothetical protein
MPMGHWLADPDKSGQAVHSGSFTPAFTLSLNCQNQNPSVDGQVLHNYLIYRIRKNKYLVNGKGSTYV